MQNRIIQNRNNHNSVEEKQKSPQKSISAPLRAESKGCDFISKVYVVTSGEYSDYSIDAVFDNREDAEVYCALGYGEMVEEYELHSEAPKAPQEQAQRIVYRYHVYYPYSGTGSIFEPCYLFEGAVEADMKKIIKSAERSGWKNNVIDCPYHIDRFVYLKERNKSKALKIVRDRIAKAKAEREGL